jgi:hypothetical protein
MSAAAYVPEYCPVAVQREIERERRRRRVSKREAKLIHALLRGHRK